MEFMYMALILSALKHTAEGSKGYKISQTEYSLNEGK